MRLFSTLPLALAATSSMALADCPTAADLPTGIKFTQDNGDVEVFQTLNDNVITSTLTFDDPPQFRAQLGQGIYLLETVDVEGGKMDMNNRFVYSYPVPLADLPIPTPGGAWQVTVAVVDPDGFRTERQFYSFGAATRITYGACGYDMLPINVRYPDESPERTELLHYLPELGVAYLAEGTFEGQTDRYVVVSVAPGS